MSALIAETGRAADEFVQDALAGYFEELAQVRDLIDSRYDDIKSDQVAPIDGEAFFDSLRQREEALLKKTTPDDRSSGFCPASFVSVGYYRHLGIPCSCQSPGDRSLQSRSCQQNGT